MASWTSDQNTYLSCLLDDVTGTKEMVAIRRDYCRILDFMVSSKQGSKNYFSGSKAEGLDLPGSDEDFMIDINKYCDIEVSDSIQELSKSSCANKFLVITESVPPGYALLKGVGEVLDQFLRQSMRHIDIPNHFAQYLSSNAFLSFLLLSEYTENSLNINKAQIQGPSMETWVKYTDINKIGTDVVASIHCKKWPFSAAEWIDRPRHHGWPSSTEMKNIVNFGFHLVSVGHPLSPLKSLEWRISFSNAERRLVWSFHHIQLQCYAVMKIILKEFVKVKCSENTKDVLCSYFIKTFLFWQFEKTEQSFWQITNLRQCLNYLLYEFVRCIHIGVLQHYFIPHFNLFEVKLTPDARRELLQIFDIVIQSDLTIMTKCVSLKSVWLKFIQHWDNAQTRTIRHLQARRIADNDKLLVETTSKLALMFLACTDTVIDPCPSTMMCILGLEKTGRCQSHLLLLLIYHLHSIFAIGKLNYSPKGNKNTYHLMKVLGVARKDISSNKIWIATYFLYKEDYSMALRYVNNVLSSIPPYALYCSALKIRSGAGAYGLYRDTYCTRELDLFKRVREAWLFDIMIWPMSHQIMPRAIQIELSYCDSFIGIRVSPFTYAYFLMFLCYHELGQCEGRDHALHELVETVNDQERCSVKRYTSYNIVAHCLLLVGKSDMARDLLFKSVKSTYNTAVDQYNPAYIYLSYM